MYLFILEDGEILKSVEVTQDDFDMVDIGILEIISISGPQPVTYYKGDWRGINTAPKSVPSEPEEY